jgi:nucleoside-diphosphate-sugar epimerase
MNWNGKRVLVTGAEGFIGSHVVKRLLQEGAVVHALVKPGSSLWRIRECINQLTVLEADITDAASLQSNIPHLKPQMVFHLAALVDVSRSWELIAPLVQTNLVGTINLISAVRETPLEAFLHASSSEEYGDAPSPIPESQRESPISPYSFSKAAAAHVCQMAARTFDLPVIVARLFPVYGPFQEGSMFIPSAIRDLLTNREFRMSPGEQEREFTYVDDVIEAYLRLAHCPDARGEVINVGSGIPHKMKEVIDLIRACLEEEVSIQMGALPYRTGEGMRCYCDNRKLKRLTGWEPRVSLPEGLRRTVDWYKTRSGASSGQRRDG